VAAAVRIARGRSVLYFDRMESLVIMVCWCPFR
jgi:hypothetical protein